MNIGTIPTLSKFDCAVVMRHLIPEQAMEPKAMQAWLQSQAKTLPSKLTPAKRQALQTLLESEDPGLLSEEQRKLLTLLRGSQPQTPDELELTESPPLSTSELEGARWAHTERMLEIRFGLSNKVVVENIAVCLDHMLAEKKATGAELRTFVKNIRIRPKAENTGVR